MRRWLKVLVALAIAGLFIGGLLLLIAFPLGILPAVIRQRLIFGPKSDGAYSTITSYWQKLPDENHFDFYLFNTTNPDEAEFLGQKVSVIEYGPYSFKETEFKDNITWLDDENEVFFQNEKQYVWDPSRSCKTCSYNDVFVLPNSVYMAVSNTAKQYHMGPLKTLMMDLSLLMMGEYPYKLVPMRGVLFEGYDDPMAEMMNCDFFKKDIPAYFNMTLEELFGFPMPNIKYAGYFAHYNNTNDENYIIKTGKTKSDDINQIVEWANSPKLHWWGDDYSNQLAGLTDGSFNKPFPKKTDKIRIFRSFSCRTYPLTFERETKVEGIDGYVFRVSKDAYNTQLTINRGYVFNNTFNKNYFPEWPCGGKSSAPPENSTNCEVNCFDPEEYCSPCCDGSTIRGRLYLPPGIVSLKCLPGKNQTMPIPAFLSPPHFADSPPEVHQSIIGLNPDQNRHSSGQFTFQPLTGNAIGVKFRLQVSIAVYQDDGLTSLNNMRSSMVPVIWVEVNADPADYAIKYLYTYTVVIPRAILGIGICFTAIPCIIAAVFTIMRVRRRRMESFTGPISRTSEK